MTLTTKLVPCTDPAVTRAMNDLRDTMKRAGVRTNDEAVTVCSTHICIAAACIREAAGANEAAAILRAYADGYAAQAQFDTAEQAGPAPSQEVH